MLTTHTKMVILPIDKKDEETNMKSVDDIMQITRRRRELITNYKNLNINS